MAAKVHAESVAIAGEDYRAEHIVRYEFCLSIAQQNEEDISPSQGSGAVIDNVCDYADALFAEVTTIASVTTADALPLRCEHNV